MVAISNFQESMLYGGSNLESPLHANLYSLIYLWQVMLTVRKLLTFSPSFTNPAFYRVVANAFNLYFVQKLNFFISVWHDKIWRCFVCFRFGRVLCAHFFACIYTGSIGKKILISINFRYSYLYIYIDSWTPTRRSWFVVWWQFPFGIYPYRLLYIDWFWIVFVLRLGGQNSYWWSLGFAVYCCK